MGLFSSKKDDNSNDSRDSDQDDPKWSFWGGGSTRHGHGARAVDRERRQQNPNGWRRSGRW